MERVRTVLRNEGPVGLIRRLGRRFQPPVSSLEDRWISSHCGIEPARNFAAPSADYRTVAGTAELNGYNLDLNRVRCAALSRCASEWFGHVVDTTQAQYWTGLRPATPSNVPLIGRTRYRNLYLNTGHGTLGWTMSCGSGKALAEIINGRKPEIVEATGLPLGFFEDAEYEEFWLATEPGDVCVFFSDGIVDARNQNGDGFGRERIHEIVAASCGGSASDILDAIFAEVTRHAEGVPTFDDQTIVVLKVKERRSGSRPAAKADR